MKNLVLAIARVPCGFPSHGIPNTALVPSGPPSARYCSRAIDKPRLAGWGAATVGIPGATQLCLGGC